MIPCPLKPVCAQYCNEFRVFENLAKLKKDNKKSKKSKSSEVTKKPAFIKKKKKITEWIIMDPCPICVAFNNEYQVFLNSTTIEVERQITGKSKYFKKINVFSY